MLDTWNIRVNVFFLPYTEAAIQRYSHKNVLWKYAANLQETPMPKCNFNKVALQLYWNHISAWLSPVNLLHIFRTPFPINTSGRLLLVIIPCIVGRLKNLIQKWSFKVLCFNQQVLILLRIQKAAQFRSSRSQMFFEIGVLKIFAIFTGKLY